jgi:signal peptidase I
MQKNKEFLKKPKNWWQRPRLPLGEMPWKAAVWEWVESIIVAFLLAMVIRTYLFQPFKIPSGSMIPTLIVGDRLFVNKLAYGPMLLPYEVRWGKMGEPKALESSDGAWWQTAAHYRLPGFVGPRRGDVIVFRYPVTRDKDFIKRLIAFGGETVEIRGGKIWINGRMITDGPIANIRYYNYGQFGEAGRAVKVPPGHYFVMGDNSLSSHDSRFWGFVPEDFVIGKAEVLFWPPNRIRWIK